MNKPNFTFNDLINSRIEATEDQQRADDAFHLSRAMFAFVNNVLRYKTQDKRDHANWLNQDYGVDEIEFESITRGYINSITPEKCRCILYKGISHGITDVKKEHLLGVVKLWKECFPDSDELEVWTGCKIGKIGEVWEPIKHIMTFNKTSMENLIDTYYAMYKTQWLLLHNHTIDDIIQQVQDFVAENYDRESVESCLGTFIVDAFQEWEKDCGFNGEIYVCREEFVNTDFILTGCYTHGQSDEAAASELETYNAWRLYVESDKTMILND